MTPIHIVVAAVALSLAFGFLGGVGSMQRPISDQNVFQHPLFVQAHGGRRETAADNRLTRPAVR